MARDHGRGDAVDVLPPPDVADLVLAVELCGKLSQPVLAPREQDDAPLPRGEQACDGLADPTRRAGDDGYAL
jgi:hypothetical protein